MWGNMGFFKRKKPEIKQSEAGSVISATKVGQAQWTPHQYDKLAKEGYQINSIAYACINLFAESFASIPWCAKVNGEQLDTHPIIDLLNRPSPTVSGQTLWIQLAAFYKISGNGYLEVVTDKSKGAIPKELYCHRPDRMKIIPGMFGVPQAYEYEVNGQKHTWDVDPITAQGKLWHVKSFNPLDDWYGMGAIQAAAYAIDQHNASSAHNAALLQNGLQHGGLMIVKGASADAMERLEQRLLDRFSGAENAGRPLLLGGEAEWKDTSSTLKDADYIEGKNQVARELSFALGVPPQLIGIAGDSTYNNQAEANVALWQRSIIPFVKKVCDDLNNWLVPMYKTEGLELGYDLSEISALTPVRKEKADEATTQYKEGIITLNEARLASGYDEAPTGGDEFKPSPMMPTQVKNSLLIVDELDQPEIHATTGAIVSRMLKDMVDVFGKNVVEEIGNIAGFEDNIRVRTWIDTHAGDLISNINTTTKNEIRRELLEGIAAGETVDEIGERINGVFDFAEETRSVRIANTEATIAAGFAANEAMHQSGIEMKEWFTTFANSRDTHTALDGQRVPIDAKFITPSGDSGKHPGDFSTAAENVNCNCAIGAVIVDEGKSRDDFIERRERERSKVAKKYESELRKLFSKQRESMLKRYKAVNN